MTKGELRAELLLRTGWTRQTLSRHVQAVKDEMPMDTKTAQCVLAHRHRIRLDQYLTPDALAGVQGVLARIGHGRRGASPAKGNGGVTNGSGSRRRTPRTIVFPKEFKTSDPLLSDVKLQEAREMAAVYPILYVLENSIRELIKRVMTAKYGADWWDTALTSGNAKQLKVNSDRVRAREKTTAWHQRRGAHPIDYVTLADLGTIIEAKQDAFFPDVLGDSKQFVHNLVRELAASRNVLCHMNPLVDYNIDDIKVKAERWRHLIEGHLENIPDAV